MSKLPVIKTAAGYTFDTTLLEVNDVVVMKCDVWPHNFVLQFKSIGQYMGADRANNIYVAIVDYKPNQGMQIATHIEPELTVFKAIPEEES